MIGDMAEPLIYSWNNHKHCTNAMTAPCLLLVVAWSLEPDIWLCACEAAPWDRPGTGLAERAAGVRQCLPAPILIWKLWSLNN